MALKHTVHKLRQRPVHERTAIARLGAFSVVGVLLAAWAVFFVSTVNTSNLQVSSLVPVDAQTAQAVTAATSQMQQQYASSTQSIQQMAINAEIEAQREQDAAQSATGTAATTTDGTPLDSAGTPTYSQ